MNLTGTWPTAGDPRDPWADEPFPATGFADYRAHGGTEERSVYDALVADFRKGLTELRTGAATDARPLRDLAEALRLDCTDRHEPPVRPHRATRLPTHAELARVATDLCPAGGAEALDRLLGPLADTLDLHRPAHRQTALATLAAFCFTLPDGSGHADGRSPQHGRTPFEQWKRRKPLPTAEERADFRAIARAPVGVYSLEAEVDGRWRLAERLGLAEHVLPEGLVLLPEVGAPWRPPRPGDTLVGRVAWGPDGWEARGALVIPSAVPLTRLRTWLTLALWEVRLVDRRRTVEALQRRHGHTLTRRVIEWGWFHGDEDPYRDPVLYDLEHGDQAEDLHHYTALAREQGGPVLELGCGTGRLTVALARAGADVDGLDLAQPMLDGLWARVAREPAEVQHRVRAWQADFRSLSTGQRYPLVLWPFNALHHCRGPDEIRDVLDGVGRLIAPGGLLAVDCYLPALDLYDRDPSERVEPRTLTHPATGERMESWEQGWYDPDLQVHHVRYIYRREDGTESLTRIQFRMYELEELRALFRRAGWSVRSEARDFEGNPLGDDPLKWVAVLERD